MQPKYTLPLLGAALAHAQGGGEGYPPPPPQTLATTKSGVLPVLPTNSAAFEGVEVNEGAIVYVGEPNPTFEPVNGPATTASSLPMATYMAELPSTNFDNGFGSLVTGNMMISSNPSILGVAINIDFSGFPDAAAYGPFVYHIHAKAVPADGNCTATLGHLDPTDRGEYYPCNAAEPSSCQVGDLSGKHGNVTASGDFTTAYSDYFLSTDPSSPAFAGDKSVVIHSSNATRITCANFMMVNGNGTMGGAAPSGTGTGVGAMPSASLPAQQTGGASGLSWGGLAAVAALVAAIL